MMQPIVFSELVNRAAWTLTHFLWEGALIAALACGVLKLLSRRSAQARYAVAVGALFAMIAAPSATFAFYTRAGSISRAIILRFAELLDPSVLSRAAVHTGTSPHLTSWTTWVVWLWSMGVLFSSLRMLVAWRLTQNLLKFTSDAVSEPIKQMFEAMKARMAFTRPVSLLLSERIDGPAVIGWLRPVVLLPVSAVTGLDVGQLQAVLAHELAHICRHDFFVNVLQQCVESLLFYHPAVWWLSRRIRIEREHVCDDLAVAMCGDPAVYATALVELERGRTNVPHMAMAAARGSLKSRIRRIFGWTPEGRDWREAAAAAMFVLTVLVAAAWQTKTVDARSIQIPVAQTVASSPLLILAHPTETGPVAALASALTALATAQNPSAKSKASIQGTVVRTGTGEPISGAHLMVTPVRAFAALTSTTGLTAADELAFAQGVRAGTQIATGAPSITTDSQGRFSIDDLDAGSYRISVAAGGYVRQEYGQRSSNGPGAMIVLEAGQTFKDVMVRMTPASTVSGMIRNTLGKPVADVPVQLLKSSYNSAGQLATQVVGSARTDDRGQYRLYWVTPGRYYLTAGAEPIASGPRGAIASNRPTINYDPDEMYSLTYFPGVPDRSTASVVEVLPDSQSNADFVVSSQSLYRVMGRVVDSATGKPPASVMLSLVYRNLAGGSDSFARGSSYNPATGEFEMRNVSPGLFSVQATVMQYRTVTTANAAYSLSIGTPTPGQSYTASASASGRTPVTLTTANVSGVVVTIVPNVSIKGKVTVDDTTRPSDLATLRVQLRPTSDVNSLAPATLAADGTFQIDGVSPGEYRFGMVPFPVNYYVKEVHYGGNDGLNKPMNIASGATETMEVILSPRVAEVTGTVIDDKQQPAQGLLAVLIPDQHRDRVELFRAVMTDQNGQFSIRGIPPGDYKLFAWESLEPYAYFDLELLKRDEQRGMALKIRESDKTSVRVKMIPSGAP